MGKEYSNVDISYHQCGHKVPLSSGVYKATYTPISICTHTDNGFPLALHTSLLLTLKPGKHRLEPCAQSTLE